MDEFVELSWGGDDGDGVGRLTVVASANGFAGRGRGWFDRRTIEAFGDALNRYPLDADDPPSITGGFGGDTPQVHVALAAYPIGRRGQVGVAVDLATELWPEDRPEGQHRVRLELPTTYERLGHFARDVARLGEKNGQTARIEAERLA